MSLWILFTGIRGNKIKTHIVSVEGNGGIEEDTIPYETILCLENQIRMIFKEYNDSIYEKELEDIQETINILFNGYTKNDFGVSNKINYLKIIHWRKF